MNKLLTDYINIREHKVCQININDVLRFLESEQFNINKKTIDFVIEFINNKLKQKNSNIKFKYKKILKKFINDNMARTKQTAQSATSDNVSKYDDKCTLEKRKKCVTEDSVCNESTGRCLKNNDRNKSKFNFKYADEYGVVSNDHDSLKKVIKHMDKLSPSKIFKKSPKKSPKLFCDTSNIKKCTDLNKVCNESTQSCYGLSDISRKRAESKGMSYDLVDKKKYDVIGLDKDLQTFMKKMRAIDEISRDDVTYESDDDEISIASKDSDAVSDIKSEIEQLNTTKKSLKHKEKQLKKQLKQQQKDEDNELKQQQQLEQKIKKDEKHKEHKAKKELINIVKQLYNSDKMQLALKQKIVKMDKVMKYIDNRFDDDDIKEKYLDDLLDEYFPKKVQKEYNKEKQLEKEQKQQQDELIKLIPDMVFKYVNNPEYSPYSTTNTIQYIYTNLKVLRSSKNDLIIKEAFYKAIVLNDMINILLDLRDKNKKVPTNKTLIKSNTYDKDKYDKYLTNDTINEAKQYIKEHKPIDQNYQLEEAKCISLFNKLWDLLPDSERLINDLSRQLDINSDIITKMFKNMKKITTVENDIENFSKLKIKEMKERLEQLHIDTTSLKLKNDYIERFKSSAKTGYKLMINISDICNDYKLLFVDKTDFTVNERDYDDEEESTFDDESEQFEHESESENEQFKPEFKPESEQFKPEFEHTNDDDKTFQSSSSPDKIVDLFEDTSSNDDDSIDDDSIDDAIQNITRPQTVPLKLDLLSKKQLTHPQKLKQSNVEIEQELNRCLDDLLEKQESN